jgi:hypothetical protein
LFGGFVAELKCGLAGGGKIAKNDIKETAGFFLSFSALVFGAA